MPKPLRPARSLLPIDFPVAPFHSIPNLLLRATRLYFSALPILVPLTLLILIPAKYAVQLACSLWNVPTEGVLSYLLLDACDLAFGALIAPAIIYALVTKLRSGRLPAISDALSWGSSLWSKSLWTRFKAEITIALWSLLLFIPGIVALVRLVFTDAIVAIEGHRTREVLDRSRDLARGHAWRIFFAILPALPLNLIHMYITLRAMKYSPWLIPPVDTLGGILDEWLTVTAVLIYLSLSTRRPRR